MDLFVTLLLSLTFLRIFSLVWVSLVLHILALSSLNTRVIYKIDHMCNYSLPIIWIAILTVLLFFSNTFLFLSNEFVLIISAAFLIPYVFNISYGSYIGAKSRKSQSLIVETLLNTIGTLALVAIRGFPSRLRAFIIVIREKKILIPSNGELIPIPPAGKEFDTFFTEEVQKFKKIVSQFSAAILILGAYIPFTLASYFLFKEEGVLPINRVTIFGIFMIILGLINFYSARPIHKQRFGLSVEEENRVINPLLKSSFFIGIFLIPAMFVWAGYFDVGLTLTYILIFVGLTFLSVVARERIAIKGSLSLRLLESSGMDFQTYVPLQMISGSLIMAFVAYPFLKSYEVSGAIKALTSVPAEILTIAIGAFYASFISLLVMINIARNMSNPDYEGNRDSLAKNSLLYLYLFISLTFFGTFLVGITPSNVIVHNYNPTIFNVGVIFASGVILYAVLIELPYRLGAQRDRNRKLKQHSNQLKVLDQQLDDLFSKKLHSDFTLLFYQSERLKSCIDELNKTPVSLFRRLPLPAAVAALLSGILMQIAVPRLTEVIQQILRT
jgi:hypothetical protein